MKAFTLPPSLAHAHAHTTDSIPVHDAVFGEGEGEILLDDLRCTGDEATLLDCLDQSEIGSHNCVHGQDAGVICDGEYSQVVCCLCISREICTMPSLYSRQSTDGLMIASTHHLQT